MPSPDLAAQAGAHVAKVYGEPMLELPRDLYIPPEALEVFLETFEGPLDLLLYLIRRQNINVLDIPMAELTRQYLGYVEMMRRTQLELAAEYLLMAAVLIEIKSRLLLPKPPAPAGAEAEDPRAELVRRLLEYERMKEAARGIDELPLADRDFSTVRVWFDRVAAARLPDVSPGDLRAAWAGLVARAQHQPASSGHARAAVGARRDEPDAEGARAVALRRVHGAVRRARRRRAPGGDVSRAARARARAAGRRSRRPSRTRRSTCSCAASRLRARRRTAMTTSPATSAGGPAMPWRQQSRPSGSGDAWTRRNGRSCKTIKGILEARAADRRRSRCRRRSSRGCSSRRSTPNVVRRLLDELREDWTGAQGRARAGRLAAGASRASRRSSPISTGCRRRSRRATRAR